MKVIFCIFLPLILLANTSVAQVSSSGDSAYITPTWICTSYLKYPKEAEENKISGTVIVVYDTDSNCHIINIRIEKGIGFGCDEEAMRVLRDSQRNCKGLRPKNCMPLYNLRIPFTFLYNEE